MAYIGREPTNSGQFLLIDDISSQFNGSKQSFTLQVGGNDITPAKENIIVAIDGVLQEATSAYSVSGSTITFTGSPASDASFYGVLTGESQFIANNSISDDNISPTANISGSKINTDFSAQSFQLTNVTASGDISGSSSSTFSGGTSTFTNYGGNVSGSSTSTGSFGRVKADGGVIVDDITIDGTEIDLSSGDLTVDVEGDIILDANGADIKLKDNGTEFGRFSRVSSDLVIKSISNNNDILFKGVDGSSTITALQLDMSEAGNAIFNNDVTIAGTLTAQEIHTEFESASILFTSGSTRFGDDTTDTHRVTGSMDISGSFKIPHGDLIVTDNIGIGTSTVVSELHLAKTSGEFGIKLTNNATGHTSSDGAHFNLDANNDLNLGTKDSTNIVFETADSERVRIKSDGKMGIGTNNPNELLHVEGSSPSIRIKASNEGGEPELKLQSDQGDDHDDLFSIRAVNEHALNIINFTGDTATSMMFISGSGQIGIGTATPVQPLHIHRASNSQMQFTDNASGAASADGLRVGWNGSLAQVYLFEDADLRFATNNAERMRITSGGNVGIGTATADRNSKLHVSGSATGGSDSDVLITNTKTTAQFHRGLTALHPNISNTHSGMIMFGNAESSGNSGHISFVNNASDGNESVRIGIFGKDDLLSINGEGQVFIGTGGSNLNENDSHRLLVARSGASWINTYAYGSYPAFNMKRSNNSTVGSFSATSDGDIIGVINAFGADSDSFNIGASIDIRQDGTVGTYTPARIDFYAAAAESISFPQMSIDGPANCVGIGNKTPAVKLDIDAHGASDILKLHNDSNSTGITIGYSTNLGSIDLAASQALRIRQGSSTPFLLNTNGVMDGDFNDTSDIALKKDIEDLTNTIDGVKALKPSTFKWIDELRGDRTKIGFIAQDIEEHFPELIDGEDGRKSISTIGLVSVLTKTIQDLIKRIEELEK